MVIDPEAPAEDSIALAASVLAKHGVIVYPTETFYALGASFSSDAAFRRIYEIKGREASKQLPLIACDLEQVRTFCVVSPRVEALARRFWPGPLTLVLPALQAPPAQPLARSGPGHEKQKTWAVRVSSSAVGRALAGAAGPLSATSANPSGAPPSVGADEIPWTVAGQVDLILDGGRTPGGLASTLADLTVDPPELIREGAIPFDAILRSLT